jgi:hypothetical protein
MSLRYTATMLSISHASAADGSAAPFTFSKMRSACHAAESAAA